MVSEVSVRVVHADGSFLVYQSFVDLVEIFSSLLRILLDHAGGFVHDSSHNVPVHGERGSFVGDIFR